MWRYWVDEGRVQFIDITEDGEKSVRKRKIEDLEGISHNFIFIFQYAASAHIMHCVGWYLSKFLSVQISMHNFVFNFIWFVPL